MRSSQAILRRSRFLLNLNSPSRPRAARKDLPSRVASRVPGKRLSSSSTSVEPGQEDQPSNSSQGPSDPSNEGPEPPAEDLEKPKIRRTRLSTVTVKESDPIELPQSLDILWLPELIPEPDSDLGDASALPPPEIFEEALHNLHITLHPQTQNRAAHASPLGPPIEPTMALYCPIEGGEYIIDATVRELARQAGADVVVLDAVQLAAGQWGHFGQAADSLQLPRNPLHFPSTTSSSMSNRRDMFVEEDEEPDTPSQILTPSRMTLTLMTPPPMQGRAIMTSSPRRTSPPSKIKIFFDALVNIAAKPDPSGTTLMPQNKPRIIYVRDFPTSPRHHHHAVRQRRRGLLARSSSPVANPTTIIFGMSPSLVPPVPHGPSTPSGLINLLMNRNATSAPSLPPGSKTIASGWGEDELSEKAREKRLRDRLKRWERGDAVLHDEFPKLSTSQDEDSAGNHKPDFIVIGGPPGLPGFPNMAGGGVASFGDRESSSESNSSFFRSSTLVPRVRSPAEESQTRISRRREINELTMRMGVGEVGGALEQDSPVPPPTKVTANMPEATEPEEKPAQSSHERMWDEWGKSLEVWTNVRQIADRAIGSIIATPRDKPEKSSLNLTPVPWTAVHRAWVAHRSSSNLRKNWVREAILLNKTARDADEDAEDNEKEQLSTDEVLDRVKNDPELDSHEQRLLSCIVDPAVMPTSFSQVHLPPHTIDSVRTIVSLPLLHPEAFQEGILKEHGMTGCLLFGPPGTGKTLVVRALAKEAGCRMMVISPSDVMDMYVGEGEKLVRAVFSLARRLSPCVVFLDEIDALFGARTSGRESGGAMAHRGVITEFMQEMDGLKTSKEDSVIVIGATNRPFDLDDAVLRRLPRRLLVDLPGEKEREAILGILLRDESLSDDLSIHNLAKQTESFSGSDLKHLCVAAALDAVKERVDLPWKSLVKDAQESTGAAASGPTPAPETALDAEANAPPASRSSAESTPAPNQTDEPTHSSRMLHLRNFTKALKEITPSSSESLGSLSELRKWNEEFGEGRRDRKRQQVWGKGRFGFTDKTHKVSEEGRVLDVLNKTVSSDSKAA
ncbi:hypothetical protein BD779DRAFT_1501633 [Infundibulicybe gibba]|nr:hypothetical protein BD779DRAFT_1501633 [Infundibulicybe gibba]